MAFVDPDAATTAIAARKQTHIDVCLTRAVEFQTRTTGFERYELPYCALPDSDLLGVDLSVRILGRVLRAPILIGAMTGGTRHAGAINRNLAIAAQELGVGLMLGSQRIMFEEASSVTSFRVREEAPDVLLVGNLGVAQLNRGFGADHVKRAISSIDADALAFHTNPLQEALQRNGDGDFRGLTKRLAEVAAKIEHPLLLKEVGHGLSADVVRAVSDIGLAAVDIAGAGGTSWARVEQFARLGEIVHPELAEWGIPTCEALRAARRRAPAVCLIASGGLRSGVDVAKALAMGADAVAIALPLLRAALTSAEAVTDVLRRFVRELRIAMHCSGARSVAELRVLRLARVPPAARPGNRSGSPLVRQRTDHGRYDTMSTAADVLDKKGHEVLSIDEEERVLSAVETMVARDVGALVVTRDGAVAGIFTERDYLRRIVLHPSPNRFIPVKEVMSSPVIYVTPETSVDDCMALMTKCRIRYLPVIDGPSLAGIVSIGDVVKVQTEERDEQREVEIRFLQEYISAR